MQKNREIRVIISGGGTGGHIFPAIAIANAIKAEKTNAEILFVGALGRMEMQKVPAAGYNIVGLPIMGFNRSSLWKNFEVLAKLVKSLFKARKIIKDFKPDMAIGVGGYASGPLLWMASFSKVPIFIQEQNSYAGVTNKLLAKRAKKIFVAYPDMQKFFPANRIIISGNPVRGGLNNVSNLKHEAIDFFKLDPAKKTILCIGGSLGARTLNESIINNINKIVESNYQLIWQCGAYYHAACQKSIENLKNQNIKLYDFINRMDLAYAAADVVISRAGALSISELCLVSKPVILVPSPNVAEDHQTKNALALTEKNAAVMITDNDAPKKLIDETFALLNNENKSQMLANNISKFAMHDAAKNIAREIIKNVKPEMTNQ
ncbi:MAG TPA: undecaprenyldiphospho-muramoylpentapeptide beta-N-acetylglucosaminyltransferase [Bacteroidales bacterium]|nr:undecaprenyldiphospho-muramoylpentapeptide beta-N-acetylglucosaminyltransferase [Bacteroidales bacterium]